MNDTTGTQALWPQMIAALAAIDAELGLPEDGCNTTARTLAAIRQLRTQPAASRTERQACAAFLDSKADQLHGETQSMHATLGDWVESQRRGGCLKMAATMLRRGETTMIQDQLTKLTDLPPAYMLAKLAMVMPLFQEARDALTALNEVQRKRHCISPTLADRMDIAGTFSLHDWIAEESRLRSGSP